MFLTRIQRGAIRTNILLRAKAERLRFAYRETDMVRSYQRITSGSGLRTIAVSAFAAYTAVIPVLPLRAQAAASHQPGSSNEDSVEPPSSTSGLLAHSIDSIRVQSQVTDSVVVNQDQLSDVSVGASLDTVRQQQEERDRQAELQRLQDEQAQARQQQAAAILRAQKAALARATAPVVSSGGVEDQVHAVVAATFGEDQWPAMRTLIMRESGFNPNSYNTRSGACGLFQALPCSKMGGMEVSNQVQWGINYVKRRYGTPSAALAFHNAVGWY